VWSVNAPTALLGDRQRERMEPFFISIQTYQILRDNVYHGKEFANIGTRY